MKLGISVVGRQTGPDRVHASVFFSGRFVGVLQCRLAEYEGLLEWIAGRQWLEQRQANRA